MLVEEKNQMVVNVHSLGLLLMEKKQQTNRNVFQ